MFLGEMLMGSDFDGEEPGDDSKCMMADSVRGGSVLYIHTCGHFRRYKIDVCFRGFFVSLVSRQLDRGAGGLAVDDV
jgi:hypothetical protein